MGTTDVKRRKDYQHWLGGQLTQKQKLFVLHYVGGKPPLQAAIAAGVQPDVAIYWTYRTLGNAKVQKAIGAWFLVLGWEGGAALWDHEINALLQALPLEGRDRIAALRLIGEAHQKVGPRLGQNTPQDTKKPWVAMGEIVPPPALGEG